MKLFKDYSEWNLRGCHHHCTDVTFVRKEWLIRVPTLTNDGYFCYNRHHLIILEGGEIFSLNLGFSFNRVPPDARIRFLGVRGVGLKVHDYDDVIKPGVWFHVDVENTGEEFVPIQRHMVLGKFVIYCE